MPLATAEKAKPQPFSIKSIEDVERWLENREKAFGGTKEQVLQKWANRKARLPNNVALKAAVTASTPKPGIFNWKKTPKVNPVLSYELTKAMQYSEQDVQNKETAGRIQELWPTSMILADFGQCLQILAPGTLFKMGPLKGQERMAEKVAADYDYELANLNDAYRASIVCKDQKTYDQCLATAELLVDPAFGISYQKKPKDKFKDPSFLGYGDFTYFLNFREVDQTSELQIHHLGIVFGKTAEKSWGYSTIAPYASLRSQFRVPGGLGHKFYEDHRKPTASPEVKKKAKELSEKYYGICRGIRVATQADTQEFEAIAKKVKH